MISDDEGLDVIAQMDVYEIDLVTACDLADVSWWEFCDWLADFDPEHELLDDD